METTTKKNKKSKAAKSDDAVREVQEGEKTRKRQKKEEKLAGVGDSDVDGGPSPCENTETSTLKDHPTEIDDSAAAAHKAKLKKMLPTREERARREIQRKIQAYVGELRKKGITDPKEVKKWKNKMINKLKASKPGRSFDHAELEDTVLQCKDCDAKFMFQSAERVFYNKRGFSDPVRCKPCQAVKKSAFAES